MAVCNIQSAAGFAIGVAVLATGGEAPATGAALYNYFTGGTIGLGAYQALTCP